MILISIIEVEADGKIEPYQPFPAYMVIEYYDLTVIP